MVQAKKWDKMMSKHANDCKSYIAEIGSSNCPDEIKSYHGKLFRPMLKQCSSMKAALHDCTEEAAVQLVTQAPVLEVDFKSLIKTWKKVDHLLG